ncbi:hypothetical protein KM043_010178 [Ampulex compressa]|nr:hypothetical protein KM043_010178 [Ampulex compressa]
MDPGTNSGSPRGSASRSTDSFLARVIAGIPRRALRGSSRMTCFMLDKSEWSCLLIYGGLTQPMKMAKDPESAVPSDR